MTSHILANETTPLLQNSLESETENEADVSCPSSSTDGLPEEENVSRALGPHVSLHLFGSLFVDSIPGECNQVNSEVDEYLRYRCSYFVLHTSKLDSNSFNSHSGSPRP